MNIDKKDLNNGRKKHQKELLNILKTRPTQVKPSQTCHGCGRQEKKSLADLKHECICGVRCSRDENAA